MNMLATLIHKELLLEFRSKANICLYLVLTLLLSVISSFAVRSALLDQIAINRLYPGLLWLIFIFVATLVMGRVNDQEFEEGALDIIFISGVSDLTIYLAKVVAYTLLIFLGHVFSIIFLALFLNVSIGAVFIELLSVSLLVVFAYVSLSQLFSVIARGSSLAGLMLPIIILPLLTPLFFAAVELSSAILLFGEFPLGSTWFSVLVAIAAIYFALGINLYKHAVMP